MTTSEGSAASSDPPLVFDLAGRPDAARLLDRLYREILVPSFRKEELDPYETLAAGLTEEPRNIDISAAWKDPDEILGAMVGEWYPLHRVYLLSYLAALPSRRSSGTGTSLMRHLTEWSRGRQALMTLAEVDDPRRHATEALIGDPEAASPSTGASAPACSICRISSRASGQLAGGRMGCSSWPLTSTPMPSKTVRWRHSEPTSLQASCVRTSPSAKGHLGRRLPSARTRSWSV